MEEDDDQLKSKLIDAYNEEQKKKPAKARKPFEWTQKNREQFMRCQEARNRNVEQRKLAKQVDLVAAKESPLPPIEPVPVVEVAKPIVEEKVEEPVVKKKKVVKRVEKEELSSEDSDNEDFLYYQKEKAKFKKMKSRSIKKRQLKKYYSSGSESEEEEESPPPSPTPLPQRKKAVSWNQPIRPSIFFA
jgi:hypothetical protein